MLARLSVALSFVESPERRRELSRQAVAVAEQVNDLAALAYALAARCDALAGPAHIEQRLNDAEETVRLAQQVDNTDLELLGRRLRLVALLEQGDVYAAEAEADAFALVAERLRQPLYLWCVPLWQGMRALMQGRLDDVERLTGQVQAIGRRAGSDNAAMLAQSQRVVWLLEAGQTRESLELCERAFRPTQFPAAWPWLARLLAATGRRIEAGALLDRLAATDFAELPDDAQWLGCMTCVAEACLLLGHRAAAEAAYRRLAPFADRFALTGTASACFGSVSRHLGMLAQVLGRWEDATAHFEQALRDNRQAGGPLLVAHTLRGQAALLLQRADPGETEQAVRLLREAAAIYRDLGLDHWTAAAEQLLEAGATAATGPSGGDDNVFRHQQDVWSLRFAGTTVQVKDAKGLHDIARLLARPSVEFHVRDLAAPPSPPDAGVAVGAEELSEPGDLGTLLDAQARRRYQQRLSALEEEIAEAEAFSDPARAERARAERQWITAELAAAYGLHGRPRLAGDPVERARQTVKWRIRHAIGRIDQAHPALGRHLRNSIKTGFSAPTCPSSPPAGSSNPSQLGVPGARLPLGGRPSRPHQ